MPFLYICCSVTVIVLFFVIKNNIWDKPHEEIDQLRRDLKKLQEFHREELTQLQTRLQNSNSLHVQENEFTDIMMLGSKAPYCFNNKPVIPATSLP